MGKDSITFPPAVRCGSAKQDRFGASARLQAEQSAAIPRLAPRSLGHSEGHGLHYFAVAGDPGMTSNAVKGRA